jgi:hypothetical protein
VQKTLVDSSETSYHSCITSRQLLEELTELPVMFVLSFDFFDRNTLFLLLILPRLGKMTLARTRRTVESQQKLL